MVDASVTLSLTRDEALVLFDLLARYDEKTRKARKYDGQPLEFEDRAEWIVLNNVEGDLETAMAVEALSHHYGDLVEGARRRVRELFDGAA